MNGLVANQEFRHKFGYAIYIIGARLRRKPVPIVPKTGKKLAAPGQNFDRIPVITEDLLIVGIVTKLPGIIIAHTTQFFHFDERQLVLMAC